MQYRKLGKHGIKLSAISVGGHTDWGKHISDDVTEQIIVDAYEAGVNYIDSAEKYAGGKCEELIGRVIRKHGWERDSLVLGSKVSMGGRHNDGRPTQKGMHRKHIVEACERSLRNYNTDHLDLLFCHRPDPDVPAEEVVRTMNNLIQQGKILYWGTSDHSVELLMEMHTIARELGLEGPHMEQTWYNMFGRARIEDQLVPLFRSYGMGTTVYQPLCGGILTGKYNDGIPNDSRMSRSEWAQKGLTENRLGRVRKLSKIANDLGTKMATLAIAWTLKNPDVSTAIAGVSKPKQVKSNLEAVDVAKKLTDDVMEAIQAIIGDKLQIE